MTLPYNEVPAPVVAYWALKEAARTSTRYKTYTVVVENTAANTELMERYLTTDYLNCGVVFWGDEDGVTDAALELGAEPELWEGA